MMKNFSSTVDLESWEDRTYTVPVQDVIGQLDRVSWKRTIDDQRTFGYVMEVRRGEYLVKSDHGVIFVIRRGQLTKECR